MSWMTMRWLLVAAVAFAAAVVVGATRAELTSLVATGGDGEEIDFGPAPRSVAFCLGGDRSGDEAVLHVVYTSEPLLSTYARSLVAGDASELEALTRDELSPLLYVEVTHDALRTQQGAGGEGDLEGDVGPEAIHDVLAGGSATVFLLDADVPPDEPFGEYVGRPGRGGESGGGPVGSGQVSCQEGAEVVLDIDSQLEHENQDGPNVHLIGTLRAVASPPEEE